MNEQEEWTLYFASVAGIKFHPKNDDLMPLEIKIKAAARVADEMLEERKKRDFTT